MIQADNLHATSSLQLQTYHEIMKVFFQFRRVKPQLDNQESGGGEFDLKIRLLQEELDKYQVEGRDNYQTSAPSATPLINTQFAV